MIKKILLALGFSKPRQYGGPCNSWPCDVPCPICEAPIGHWCAYGEVAHGPRYEESPGALKARDDARKPYHGGVSTVTHIGPDRDSN